MIHINGRGYCTELGAQQAVDGLVKQIEKLQAENARLKEALLTIRAMGEVNGYTAESDIAQQALAAQPQKGQ